MFGLLLFPLNFCTLTSGIGNLRREECLRFCGGEVDQVRRKDVIRIRGGAYRGEAVPCGE